MCPTFDTSNAFNGTFNKLVLLMKLLFNHDFSYILPRNFQNDRLEEECGI